jgi:hypothetical protein
MWFSLAAAKGLKPYQLYTVCKDLLSEGLRDKQKEHAREELDKLEKEMTPEQIAEAQKLAREWQEKHSLP